MTPRDLVLWNSAFSSTKKVAWLLDKSELALDDRRAMLDKSWNQSWALLDNLLAYEFQTYLQPILLRQDKMSMGASIEARVPILDNDMVDLAFSIPAAHKIKKMNPKYLFKQAAENDLPSNIVHKRKVGFGVPVGAWMRANGPLTKYLDHLNDHRFNFPGMNPAKIEQLISQHRKGVEDHQGILWPLLNYSLWRDVFFNKRGSF
jgi:asparagine synthase (glutamine-hydrolysing)